MAIGIVKRNQKNVYNTMNVSTLFGTNGVINTLSNVLEITPALLRAIPLGIPPAPGQWEMK